MIFSIIFHLSIIAEAEAIAISIIVLIYTVYLQEDKIFTSILTVHEVLKKVKKKSRKVK